MFSETEWQQTSIFQVFNKKKFKVIHKYGFIKEVIIKKKKEVTESSYPSAKG